MRGYLGVLRDTLDRAICGIGGGGQDEEDLIVAVIELGQGDKITLEPGFHPFARAQDGRARRIEARITAHSASYVRDPAQPVPDQVQTHGYLENGQVIEQSLHVSPSLAEPFISR